MAAALQRSLAFLGHYSRGGIKKKKSQENPLDPIILGVEGRVHGRE